MRSFFRVFLLALVAGSAACSQARQGGAVPQQANTSVRVQNNAWLDVNIYVMQQGGTRQRLGMVTGARSATLRIPNTVVGPGRDLVFQADPVGSRSVATSFRIYVRPGEQVTLTIPATLGR
jgi:hypothetical protein